MWPSDAQALDAEQARLAASRPAPWHPAERWTIAATFLASERGNRGPGAAGDRGWAAAVLLGQPGNRVLGAVCTPTACGAPYDPGRLALREGPALESALRALPALPDVLMIDATGRDHPRGAGLALHLGAVMGVPSIGVTNRPLAGGGPEPGLERGAASEVGLHGETVAAWLRTSAGVRPVVVHAGWRTGVDTAIAVALACTTTARTPLPLRLARQTARLARARAEGRTGQPWSDRSTRL